MQRHLTQLIPFLCAIFTMAFPLEPALGQETPPEPVEIKIVSLQYRDAKDAVRVLAEIYHNVPILTSVSGPDQVVIRGRKEDVAVAEALLMKLDEKRASVSPPGLTQPGDLNAYTLNAEGAGWSQWGQDEQQAASKLRSALSTYVKGHPVIIRQQKALESVVRADFDRRQNLHTQKLRQLEQTLGRLQARITEQRQHKEQIISQRIAQLTQGEVSARLTAAPATPRDTAISNPQIVTHSPPEQMNAAISLLSRLIESRQRIVNAQSNYEVSKAELHRTKSEFDARSQLDEDLTDIEKNNLIVEIRAHESRVVAAGSELETARKLINVLTLQVDAQQQLLQISVEQAQVSLDELTAETERLKKLKHGNFISEAEMDKKLAELKTAELRLRRARTILDAFQQSAK